MGAGDDLRRRHHPGGSSLPRWGARPLSIVAILGPTAAGKSAVAEAVAAAVGGEIVSVDSMQVYRGMDIGTAKPPPSARRAIAHHLIDLVDPSEEFTVSEYQRQGRLAIDAIVASGRTAILVGGSGLHFRSLVDPLVFPPTDAAIRAELETVEPGALRAELETADPAAGTVLDLGNPRRVLRAVEILRLTGATPSGRHGGDSDPVRRYEPVLPFTAIGLDPGDRLAGLVTARFDGMLEAGLVDEVRRLAGAMGRTASQAVGYRQLLPVVVDGSELAVARAEAIRATLGLAKRQRTFFRRDHRIRWMAWQDDAGLTAARVLAGVERETAWTF